MKTGKTRLYIHIGTWKTGSSTIQFNLHRLKEDLKQEGIYYLSKKDKMVIDDRIIRDFEKIEPEYVSQSRRKLKGILNNSREEGYKYIASAEEFSGDPFSGFKNCRAVAENIFEITKDLNLDIKIIVYLRRQDDFIESMYTQSIHLGGVKTFQEFISDFDESHFNWYNLLKAYSDVFGKKNIDVRRYHKAFLPHKNSLMQDFGSAVNSNLIANYSETVSKNKGLSRNALELTRITNKHLNDEEQYQLRKLFQEINSKNPFEKYAFFESSERKEFLARYKNSNLKIAKEYMGIQDGPLFPSPDISETPPPYPGFNPEAMAVTLSRALLAVNYRAQKENKKTAKRYRKRIFKYRIYDKFSEALSRFPSVKEKVKWILGKKEN